MIGYMTQKKLSPHRHSGTVYAILMGDIVGSERARSIKAVHKVFNKAVDSVNDVHVASIASPLTITLGDEFQGLLHGLVPAWEIAAALRLELLTTNVSCRFVIGITELDTPLNTKRAWNMMGAGFSAARDKLNDKKSTNAYRFSLPGEALIERLMDAVGDSLTQIEFGWTRTQLKYYATVHQSGRTKEQVSKRLGVGARSLYKVLHAARAEFHQRQSGVLRDALLSLEARLGMQ
jgi:hypothetical protein